VDDQHETELIDRIAAELRQPVHFGDALDRRVMAELRRLPPRPAIANAASQPGGAWQWLVQPRTVRVSPLLGLAAAAGIAIVATLGIRGTRASHADGVLAASRPAVVATSASAPRDTVRIVQFVLVSPAATTVSVVGSFNDWDAHATPLRRAGTAGVWTVDLPLHPGRYTYTFVVNGTKWVADPSAPAALEDDFGTPSSVLTVGAET
jgi:hypothetical protein